MSDVKSILRARAEALAARAPEHSSIREADGLDVLEFRLAHEHYAVETRYVREVSPLRNLAKLPSAPAFIVGIVNVRGRIVPVVDLEKFFGLAEEGLTDLHRIIRVASHDLEFGLLADVSVGMRSIPKESLQPAPASSGIGGDYVKGVTAERLIVLDLARIAADPRIVVREEVEN